MERLPQIGVMLRKSQQEALTRALKNGWCVEREGGGVLEAGEHVRRTGRGGSAGVGDPGMQA